MKKVLINRKNSYNFIMNLRLNRISNSILTRYSAFEGNNEELQSDTKI